MRGAVFVIRPFISFAPRWVLVLVGSHVELPFENQSQGCLANKVLWRDAQVVDRPNQGMQTHERHASSGLVQKIVK